MSLFTTADRDAVKAAYVAALTSGYASVSIAGETVTSHNPDVFAKLLDRIQADLAGSSNSCGIRIRQGVPGGCG